MASVESGSVVPGAQSVQVRHTWQDFWMLLVIVTALVTMFLGGLAILLNATSYAAVDVVAVLSPALAAVGTVAGGIFGYSLGTRGTTAAQETATNASQQATAARQDAATIAQAATPLSRSVERIIGQAKQGGEASGLPGSYIIGDPDLKTLADAAAVLASLPQVHG